MRIVICSLADPQHKERLQYLIYTFSYDYIFFSPFPSFAFSWTVRVPLFLHTGHSLTLQLSSLVKVFHTLRRSQIFLYNVIKARKITVKRTMKLWKSIMLILSCLRAISAQSTNRKFVCPLIFVSRSAYLHNSAFCNLRVYYLGN